MGKHRKITPGDVYESLEVLENLGYRKYCGETTTYWKCRCTKCGNIIEVPQKNLGKAQKDCGCWRNLPKSGIEPGMVFGRLRVIELGKSDKKHSYTYLCECSCPKHTRIYVRRDRLLDGTTTSCGCVHDELFCEKIQSAHALNYVNNTSVNKLTTDLLQKNNTSGVRGVSWHKGNKKWCARVMYQKETYYLGYYDNLEDAEKAVRTARKHFLNDFMEWYSVNSPERYKKLHERKKLENNNNDGR